MYLIVKLKTEINNNRKTTRSSIWLIPCDEHKKILSKQKRLIIADETKLVLDEVRFSGVRAVTTPTQTKTENDIKRWESIYFKSLI